MAGEVPRARREPARGPSSHPFLLSCLARALFFAPSRSSRARERWVRTVRRALGRSAPLGGARCPERTRERHHRRERKNAASPSKATHCCAHTAHSSFPELPVMSCRSTRPVGSQPRLLGVGASLPVITSFSFACCHVSMLCSAGPSVCFYCWFSIVATCWRLEHKLSPQLGHTRFFVFMPVPGGGALRQRWRRRRENYGRWKHKTRSSKRGGGEFVAAHPRSRSSFLGIFF